MTETFLTRSTLRICAAATAALLAACGGTEDSTGPGSPGSVHSVQVTALGPTSLAIGDSTWLTATIRDSLGRPVIGKTVSWASSDVDVATVAPNEGAVVGVGPGTTTITATADGVSGSSEISGVLVRMAYALAEVTPPSIVYRNLGGGTSKITRWNTGDYTVTFNGVGRGIEGGTAFAMFASAVNSVDNSALQQPEAVCFTSVSNSFNQLDVTVRCYDVVTRAPRDSRFRVVGVGNGVLATPNTPNIQNAFSMWRTDSTPGPNSSWNSTGVPMATSLLSVNTGHVRHLMGLNMVAPFTSVAGTFVAALSCQLTSLPTSTYTDVVCFGVDDRYGYSTLHQVMAIQAGRPGTPWGYVLTSGATGQPNLSRSASSSGQQPTVVQIATGRSRVTFPGVIGRGPALAIVITPVNAQAWTPCSHALVSTSPITVDVACFDSAGQFVNVSFVLAVWH